MISYARNFETSDGHVVYKEDTMGSPSIVIEKVTHQIQIEELGKLLMGGFRISYFER